MAKNFLSSRAPKNGRSTPRRSAKNPSQKRNDVQIFRVRTALGPPKPPSPEILTKASQSDARGDCQTLPVEVMFRFPGSELRRELRVHFHVSDLLSLMWLLLLLSLFQTRVQQCVYPQL